MFCVILKATNSSLQKGMPFCCNIYVKKVMKLLAFIFKQPSNVLTLRRILALIELECREGSDLPEFSLLTYSKHGCR